MSIKLMNSLSLKDFNAHEQLKINRMVKWLWFSLLFIIHGFNGICQLPQAKLSICYDSVTLYYKITADIYGASSYQFLFKDSFSSFIDTISSTESSIILKDVSGVQTGTIYKTKIRYVVGGDTS